MTPLLSHRSYIGIKSEKTYQFRISLTSWRKAESFPKPMLATRWAIRKMSLSALLQVEQRRCSRNPDRKEFGDLAQTLLRRRIGTGTPGRNWCDTHFPWQIATTIAALHW